MHLDGEDRHPNCVIGGFRKTDEDLVLAQLKAMASQILRKMRRDTS